MEPGASLAPFDLVGDDRRVSARVTHPLLRTRANSLWLYGEAVWRERLGGVFTASPVAGDGKVYLVSETGETIVLRAGRKPDVLARNTVKAHLVASPAISRGRLFLRGDNEVVAVGK